MTTADFIAAGVLIEVGVLVSLLIPWAMAVLKTVNAQGQSGGGQDDQHPLVRRLKSVFVLAVVFLRPYWKYFGASTVVSFVVLVAVLAAHKYAGGSLPAEWWEWVAVGFAWDTILAKFLRENPLGFQGVPKPAPVANPNNAPNNGAGS